MNYVPRILLCGDANSFQSAAGDMAVEIIGEISFTGSAERGENFIFVRMEDVFNYVPKDLHIYLNGKEISADELRKILDGEVDYIVFDSGREFTTRYNDLGSLKILERFIPRETLFTKARHNFYSPKNLQTFAQILHDNKISHLLDVDGIFHETDFFMFSEIFPYVEGVVQKPEPILENFYGKIYGSLADCQFKFYDAIFIGERGPENFINVLLETNDLSENILTFARKNSSLEKFLATNANAFEKILRFPVVNGNWYLIQKRAQKNFCVYVVTHKDPKLDVLPEGYKMIHAGHAQAKEDFGYIGDDTGDNISRLNLYLNEVTVIYWLWKNTQHTIIGLNHYRRFFTTDGENILSLVAAEEILRDHDIIVAQNKLSQFPLSFWQMVLSDYDLEPFVANIFRKHIALKQPDYLAAFEKVAESFTGFQYEIFITRRNIFDAYCEWLFSFLLDVMEEVLAKTNIADIKNPRKYRIVGMFSERLMTVWLWKNHLRIKKLPVLFRKDI